jgi:hypothetical protein
MIFSIIPSAFQSSLSGRGEASWGEEIKASLTMRPPVFQDAVLDFVSSGG